MKKKILFFKWKKCEVMLNVAFIGTGKKKDNFTREIKRNVNGLKN